MRSQELIDNALAKKLCLCQPEIVSQFTKHTLLTVIESVLLEKTE
jgi:hypothetical protein